MEIEILVAVGMASRAAPCNRFDLLNTTLAKTFRRSAVVQANAMGKRRITADIVKRSMWRGPTKHCTTSSACTLTLDARSRAGARAALTESIKPL